LEHKQKEIFNVDYEIITPVHIGNGQSIPKTELGFFPNEKLIRKVDFDKFFESQPQYKINEISQKLRYARNDFFNDILKSENLSVDNLSTEYDLNLLFDYRLDDLYKLRDISAFIKTPFFKPYIPGSSIKGWLRTAILYYYIKKIKEIKSLIDDFYNQLDHLPKNKKQLRRQKGQMGKILEDKIFGKDPREDIFKFIIITDTQTVSQNSLDLILSQIYHPVEMRGKIHFESLKFSQYLEVIKTNTKFLGKIVFTKDLEGYKKEYFQTDTLSTKIRAYILENFIELSRQECLQKIREISNIFSKHILKYNINYLKKLKEEIDSSVLQRVIEYYEKNLYPTFKKIEASKDQFLIRLGAGTEWHSKTIGMFLMDYYLNTKNLDFNLFYKKINRLQLFKGQYMHKHFELAPISRTYIVDSAKMPQYPLGWVKVYIKD